MMKLGFFGMPYGTQNFMQAVDAAVAHGLNSIELYTCWEIAPEVPLPQRIENAKKIKEYADSKGVKINCCSCCIDVVTPGLKEKSVKMLQEYGPVCEAAGCKYLHHTLFYYFEPSQVDFSKTEEYFASAIDSVRRIYDSVIQYGIFPVYEDQGLIFNGVKNFGRFLNEVDRPVKVVADLGNIYYVDGDILQFIQEFLPDIVHVHIKDLLRRTPAQGKPDKFWDTSKGGNYLRSTVIGHGFVDFETAFRMLIKGGYDGYYHLECGGLEYIYPDISHINVENTRKIYEKALNQ